MAKITQYSKILNHLKATKGLTQREALLDYSIQSFTARIAELRKWVMLLIVSRVDTQ